MADLINTVKGAVELNLRYSSLLLGMSREYIKDFERVVRGGGPTRPPASGGTEPPPATGRRPPILLVGEAGETATGAFALNNTAGTDLNVTLVVQGELGPDQVEVTPSTLKLARGSGAFVRLKVRITEAMAEGKDHFGAVHAPGLASEAVEFVVRRLAGAAPADPPGRPATG